METKKCNKCLIVKSVALFGKEARAKNGYKPRCKDCTNKENKEWLDKNPGYVSKRMKIYYQKNKSKILKKASDYAVKNRESKRLYNIEYRIKNYDKINSNSLKYITNKIKTDPEFRLLRLHRKLIYRLKIEKKGRTADLLGYSHNDLLEKLGRYPKRGEHIDHKIPITWFKDMTDYKTINSLENLHILSAKENVQKGNRYSHPISKGYYNEILSKIKEEFKQKISCEHITNDLKTLIISEAGTSQTAKAGTTT